MLGRSRTQCENPRAWRLGLRKRLLEGTNDHDFAVFFGKRSDVLTLSRSLGKESDINDAMKSLQYAPTSKPNLRKGDVFADLLTRPAFGELREFEGFRTAVERQKRDEYKSSHDNGKM